MQNTDNQYVRAFGTKKSTKLVFRTLSRGAVLDLYEARNVAEAEGAKHKGGARGILNI